MRTVEEWVGKSDDSRAPPRVELRIFLAAKGCCEECGTKVMRRRDWQLDHRVALINGGENRERNLRVMCSGCHKDKSRQDVAEKAKVDSKRKAHLGIKRAKRPFRGWRRFNGERVWSDQR